jgi:ankyrin repeat protein
VSQLSRPRVHEADFDSLLDAVSAGQPDVVHTLVEAGSKVDEENVKGQTP